MEEKEIMVDLLTVANAISMAGKKLLKNVTEKYTIDKLALTDTFFLPHFNQPHNFITKAGLLALGKL